jgi:predicted RNA-binding protein with PIN domain
VAALAARTGADVHVVFDGDEQEARTSVLRPRSRVKVTFTAEGVEADDVLLDLVDTLPPRRPVAVVSDDRRVRAGATARGAAVLSSAQLLGALRS